MSCTTQRKGVFFFNRLEGASTYETKQEHVACVIYHTYGQNERSTLPVHGRGLMTYSSYTLSCPLRAPSNNTLPDGEASGWAGPCPRFRQFAVAKIQNQARGHEPRHTKKNEPCQVWGWGTLPLSESIPLSQIGLVKKRYPSTTLPTPPMFHDFSLVIWGSWCGVARTCTYPNSSFLVRDLAVHVKRS